MDHKNKIIIGIALLSVFISCNKGKEFDFRKKYVGKWKLHEIYVNCEGGNCNATIKNYEGNIEIPKTKLFSVNNKYFEIKIENAVHRIDKNGNFVTCAQGGFINNDSLKVYFNDCSFAMGARFSGTLTGSKIK